MEEGMILSKPIGGKEKSQEAVAGAVVVTSFQLY
jgi:hypothetical protein